MTAQTVLSAVIGSPGLAWPGLPERVAWPRIRRLHLR